MNNNGMPTPGLPRHRENRELESPFFQTGKTRGICEKILKICFSTGNLPPTQGKFECQKNNELGWNYPAAVLCQVLGLLTFGCYFVSSCRGC